MKDPRQIVEAIKNADGQILDASPDGIAARIPRPGGVDLILVASWIMRWDHASVHTTLHGSIQPQNRTPTWDEMNFIKDLLWHPDECAVQYHPPKADYVDDHPNTLHIWKSQNKAMPRPPKDFV